MIDHERIIASGVPCKVVKINSDGTFGESQTYNMEKFKIQDWQIERIAHCIYPDIIAFYETDEGKTIAAQIEADRIAKGLPPTSELPRRRSRRRKRK